MAKKKEAKTQPKVKSDSHCKDCGYSIRGKNHKEGTHHKEGDDGHKKKAKKF